MKTEFDPRHAHAAPPARLRAGVRCAALVVALALALPAAAVETSILWSPTSGHGAELAYALDVEGTELAIGAPGENASTGAVYVADCATLPCSAPQRIVPGDIASGDAFGSAVGVSGDTLVATAPGPEPGAAYVFVRSGSGWAQQARLAPGGGGTGERFGVSASLAGDRLAIGADRANGKAGAVYVFVRSGTAWTQEARLTANDATARDAFGASVALDADTLIAGAPLKRSTGFGHYANGAAYVFTRGGGGWSQQAKLVAATGANGDLFGFAVALDGDRGIVGAPYAASARGTAYVFERTGTTWAQQAQLAAAGGAAGDEFGWSVALGDSTIVIGAPFAGQLAGTACGSSYVFDAVSIAETGGSIEAPAPNQLAGWSVAASGPRWAVSAPGHVVGADDHAGAAYWFDPTITIFHAGFDAPGACVDLDEAVALPAS